MTEARCLETTETQNIIEISEQIWFYPDRLRKCMEAAGLSQATLARKAGVPESTVRKLLQGETRDPRASTFVPVCRAAGADANAVFGLAPVVSQPAELSREGTLLVDALRKQLDQMHAQDAESDRRLVRLREMLLDASNGKATAEGRVAALEAVLAQQAEQIRQQADTIAQQECRLEVKRNRIEELGAQASALKTTVEAKGSELAAVRKSRDSKKKTVKRLAVALCATIFLLALLCVYAVWEISNIDKGRTAYYLEEYLEEYAEDHFNQ